MWTFLLWMLLFVICWPVAVLALIAYPFVWLVLLPFRLIGIGVDAVFQTLRAMLLLPARMMRGPAGA
ncbi:MAG: hypothetical protein GKS06_08730 [Acidobacteria bacterium]|nr:hypothetical protein [Acidobacteriota bacterium]